MDTFRIKSSGESIMVIRHEPINATAFLNHHPFVREKLNYLHNLVVIKFRSCQFRRQWSVLLPKPYIPKSSLFRQKPIRGLAMDGFVDVFYRGENGSCLGRPTLFFVGT